MKRTTLLIMLFAALHISTSAQENLVPNPSFENIVQCPNTNSNMQDCESWESVGASETTPDYFNGCATNAGIIPPNLNTGYSYPHTGRGMIGIVTYVWEHAPDWPNYREFIGCQLIHPLSAHQKYFISFFIKHSGYLPGWQKIGTNKTGIRFSTISYSENNPAPLDNFAHLYTNLINIDTTQWYKVSGSFIADSSYSYLSIGNFFDVNNTDTIIFGGAPFGGSGAYYYIDDICVSTDSIYAENWVSSVADVSNSNIIKLFPNPSNGLINLESLSVAMESVKIFNSVGLEIFYQSIPNSHNYTIDLSALPQGIYYTTIGLQNKSYAQRKIVINY